MTHLVCEHALLLCNCGAEHNYVGHAAMKLSLAVGKCTELHALPDLHNAVASGNYGFSNHPT